MRFLIDAQLASALAKLLRKRGYEAQHLVEIGMLDADDSLIWEYALKKGAIVVTKDEDFPHRLSQGEKASSTIAWLRIGNSSRRALRDWFEPLIPQIVALIEVGDQLFEVR